MTAGRSVAYHGKNGRPFRLVLPRADYCDNSAERKLYTPVMKQSKRAQIAFLFLSPAIFNSLSNLFSLGTTRTGISECKPNVKSLGSSSPPCKQPLNAYAPDK